MKTLNHKHIQEENHNHYRHQHPNMMHQKFLSKIEFLDSKQRQSIMAPEILIGDMPIEQNHILLDIGAGSGFFTIPMAQRTSGKVIAVDADTRMLSVISEKAQTHAIHNIEYVQSTLENFEVQNKSIDFVMASLILHELKSLPQILIMLYDAMKYGAHLLCLEYEKDDQILEGPPMEIRLSSIVLAEELKAAGFCIIEKKFINESIYTLLATK